MKLYEVSQVVLGYCHVLVKEEYYYSAEPFQEQKTEIFQNHLKSLPFLSVTIEYKSMIDYVDRELLNQNND